MKASDYRRLSRKEKKAFKAAGGKIKATWVDGVGSVTAILVLCAVGWVVSKTSGKPDSPDRTAQIRCLAEGVNGIPSMRPDYGSVVAAKSGPRYVVEYRFTALNGLNQRIPGGIYCETDATGEAVLKIKASR